MRKWLALIASLGMSLISSAWAGELFKTAAIYTAANVADGWTTVDCQHRVPGCREWGSPGLYGEHPSTLHYFGPAFGIEAVQLAIGARLLRSKRRWVRTIGRAQMWYGIAVHGSAAIHNFATGYY